MDLGIAGRKAIVCASSRGLGRGCAEALAAAGVEVVINGRPAARQSLLADGAPRDFTFEVPIERSSWVALRILGSAHTNPVFVVVGGRAIRASKRSAEWCLKAVDQCASQKIPRMRFAERESAERAYEHARTRYRQILADSDAD